MSAGLGSLSSMVRFCMNISLRRKWAVGPKYVLIYMYFILAVRIVESNLNLYLCETNRSVISLRKLSCQTTHPHNHTLMYLLPRMMQQ